MPVMTQSKIAQHLGTPRTTVAAALNPRLASRLRPQVRQRVRDAAQQLGYVPHHAAQRLASMRPDSRLTRFDQVGLLSLIRPGEPMDPILLAMLEGAEQELAATDASLQFVRVGKPQDWARVERLATAGSIDGWLLYGAVDDAVAVRLDGMRIPFVVLGDHYSTKPLPQADVDNHAVGRLAA